MPAPFQLSCCVPREILLLSYYFQMLKRTFLVENNLNVQQSGELKNCTKNTCITRTQIHLLTLNRVCFVLWSLSAHMHVRETSLPAPSEGR